MQVASRPALSVGENSFDLVDRLPVKKRKVTIEHEEPCDDTSSDGETCKNNKRGHSPTTSSSCIIAPMRDKMWERVYELLIEYVEKNGHCKIPLSVRVQDKEGKQVNLGKWLGTQRQYKRKNLLTGSKLEKLQSLVDAGKLEWGEVKVDHDEERWNKCFNLLLEYKKQFGHCNVPERLSVPLVREDSENSEKIFLGKWLDRQRMAIRGNKMKPERLARLNELVNEGSLNTAMAKDEALRWSQCYAALMVFGNMYRHCNVPSKCEVEVEWQEDSNTVVKSMKVIDHSNKNKNSNRIEEDADSDSHSDDDKEITADNVLVTDQPQDIVSQTSSKLKTTIKLGNWLASQRHLCNKKRDCMKKERFDLLQSLVDRGMLRWGEMHIDKELKWESSFEALLRYDLEPGQLYNNIPKTATQPLSLGYMSTQIKLQQWLSKQLALHRDKKLSAEREAKLQALVDAGVLVWEQPQPPSQSMPYQQQHIPIHYPSNSSAGVGAFVSHHQLSPHFVNNNQLVQQRLRQQFTEVPHSSAGSGGYAGHLPAQYFFNERSAPHTQYINNQMPHSSSNNNNNNNNNNGKRKEGEEAVSSRDSHPYFGSSPQQVLFQAVQQQQKLHQDQQQHQLHQLQQFSQNTHSSSAVSSNNQQFHTVFNSELDLRDALDSMRGYEDVLEDLNGLDEFYLMDESDEDS